MGLELVTTKLEDAANWGRKFSLFTYPFVTACCGMEFMSVAAPKYDIARFGAEFPRFSVKFYQVAILFLVFDIETAFMYPWAVLYRDLSFAGGQMSLLGFTEMLTFVVVLVVALAYVWRKKAIGWD